MSAEHRGVDGTLRQGYYCINCGRPSPNYMGTGHYHVPLKMFTCGANPELVFRLDRANGRMGKPHFSRPAISHPSQE